MKYANAIILIIFTAQISAKKLLRPENGTSAVSECLVYILKKYFINSTKVSLKFSNQQTSILSEIISKIDLPILINVSEYEITDLEEIDKRMPNDITVIMDEQTNIFKFLTETKWTAKTQFLVIFTKSQATEKNMVDVFQKFWITNMINILLLVADTSNVHIYTFVPFNQFDCAVHKPVLIATWTSGQISMDDLIQKDRLTNLNGCTINVSVIHVPPCIIFPNEESKRKGVESVDGMEGLILDEISKKLNFKMHVAEPEDNKDWGTILPSPEGAIGEVFLKKSHFAVGSYAYNPDRYKYLDMTISVGCDIECISWAVPVGAKKSQPTWISLFTSGFGKNVWYLISAVLISAIVTFRVLSKASNTDRNLFDGNMQAILYTFRSSLGTFVQSPKSLPLKIFFCTWLWYCFVVIAAYQAMIESKLTVPERHSNIDTFKGLLESDLIITGLESLYILIVHAEEGNEDIKAVGKRFIASDDNFDQAIEKLTRDKNLAYMEVTTTFIYGVLQLNPNAKGLIHFMKQCVNEYHPVLYLQKNSPFTSKVDRIITRLFDSGLICEWTRRYLYKVPEPEPSVEKLSLKKMTGSFVILGAGWGAAIIALLAEYGFYWYSLKKKIGRTTRCNKLYRKISRRRIQNVNARY